MVEHLSSVCEAHICLVWVQFRAPQMKLLQAQRLMFEKLLLIDCVCLVSFLLFIRTTVH